MGALATILQAHLMAVAAGAQTLAAASNHSAFNAANALGPWLGGMAINAGFGWTSTGYVGAATAVVGLLVYAWARRDARRAAACMATRSEEHTSELQSLMRISYAVFCLKKKQPITVPNIQTNRQHS